MRPIQRIGPNTPATTSLTRVWFSQVGDSMARKREYPITSGVEVTPDDVSEIEPGIESFTGYSIVNAEALERPWRWRRRIR